MMRAQFHIIDLDMFRRSVVVMIGDTNDLDDTLRSRHPGVPSDVVGTMRGEWPEVLGQLRDCYSSGVVDAVGCCFTSKSGDIYIHLRKWDLQTFVHELHHAARRFGLIINTDDDETGAYFVEYVFWQVRQNMKGKRK